MRRRVIFAARIFVVFHLRMPQATALSLRARYLRELRLKVLRRMTTLTRRRSVDEQVQHVIDGVRHYCHATFRVVRCLENRPALSKRFSTAADPEKCIEGFILRASAKRQSTCKFRPPYCRPLMVSSNNLSHLL